MLILGWTLAAVFAGLALYFALRPREDPHGEALDRLTDELESGEPLGDSAPGDTPEILQLRLTLARNWRPLSRPEVDPAEAALRGLFRFVEGAVLRPLEEGLARGEPRGAAQGAVNALKDLAFFARGDRDEPLRTENLSAVVQEVTREFTHRTGVPVRFSGPPAAVPARLRVEAFKDAFYLLLTNAGRFGGGQVVDVTVEADGDEVRLKVVDRGAGFTREALDHAFDAFWTGDGDALGLGLTHARRVLESLGGRIALGNVETGGAEVSIFLTRER